MAGGGEGRSLDSRVIPKLSQGAEARTSSGERMEVKCSMDVTGASQLHHTGCSVTARRFTVSERSKTAVCEELKVKKTPKLISCDVENPFYYVASL